MHREPVEPMTAERQVMSAEAVGRAIARIAHELLEHVPSPEEIVLVGMHTRGVPLAHRIARHVQEFSGLEVPVASLDIGLYRDDLSHRGVRPRLHRTEMPADIDDRQVVLVDDVLFTGRSIRAALDALMDYGRPRRIHLAVLVDRGHRELPIRADYVGKNIPTSPQEDVQLRLAEIDGRDEVVVIAAE